LDLSRSEEPQRGDEASRTYPARLFAMLRVTGYDEFSDRLNCRTGRSEGQVRNDIKHLQGTAGQFPAVDSPTGWLFFLRRGRAGRAARGKPAKRRWYDIRLWHWRRSVWTRYLGWRL